MKSRLVEGKKKGFVKQQTLLLHMHQEASLLDLRPPSFSQNRSQKECLSEGFPPSVWLFRKAWRKRPGEGRGQRRGEGERAREIGWSSGLPVPLRDIKGVKKQLWGLGNSQHRRPWRGPRNSNPFVKRPGQRGVTVAWHCQVVSGKG